MLSPKNLAGTEFGEGCLLEEYYFLFGLAALLRPRNILEIGGNTGLGTLSLWWGAHCVFLRDTCITTIEVNPDKVPIIKKNWQVLSMPMDSLNVLVGDSRIVVPTLRSQGKHYELCFIDGCHNYDVAKPDWDNTQGMVSFWVLHDSTQMPGVRRLVREIRETDKYNVFELGRYPFGAQWSSAANAYFVKKSIPGITLVSLKDTPYPLCPDEQAWIEKVSKT